MLQPGWYRTACPFWTPDNKCPRVDDFDVTYSTSKEQFHTLSKEGLPLELHIAVAYRPIVSELYLLDTEIGPNYFDEVIGPEFRSAAIGVFAHTSYQDLQRKNGAIEDEIEKELRKPPPRQAHRGVERAHREGRLRPQHHAVAARARRLAGGDARAEAAPREQGRAWRSAGSSSRPKKSRRAPRTRRPSSSAQTEQKKLELQAEAEQKKLAATTELEVKKIEIQRDTDEEKFRIDSELRNKKAEKALVTVQAQIDKMKADADATTRVTEAKGEAAARLALAKATGAEEQAAAANITQNQVMMHAYDALGKLGGTGTTFLLGDWSKLPNWLFPRVPGFQTYTWPMAPTVASSNATSDTNPYHG